MPIPPGSRRENLTRFDVPCNRCSIDQDQCKTFLLAVSCRQFIQARRLMRYYKKVLQPKEAVKYVGKLHWIIYGES